jgi:hypothetical protein
MADGNQDEFQEWFDNLASEDHLILMYKAAANLEWSDEEFAEFFDALNVQYAHLFNSDLVEVLLEEGKVTLGGVNEDGSIGFKLA